MTSCNDSGRTSFATSATGRVALGSIAWLFAASTLQAQYFEQTGKWVEAAPVDGDYSWGEDGFAKHAMHLSTNQLLLWDKGGCTLYPDDEDIRLRNPWNGDETIMPLPELFPELGDCNGHVALPDGSILIVGGSCSGEEHATRNVFKFLLEGNPEGPWVQMADMAYARWYPTCTLLHDGRVLIF